jgi:hypothetical protein
MMGESVEKEGLRKTMNSVTRLPFASQNNWRVSIIFNNDDRSMRMGTLTQNTVTEC